MISRFKGGTPKQMNVHSTLCCLAMVVAMLAGSIIAASQPNEQTQSCRTRSDLVGKCFNVHGRLSIYNGTPSIRLWPIGTKRLLGVIDPADISGERRSTVLPLNVKSKLDWDKDVFGEFLVCPLSKQRPGWMQTVCIESGKNIIIHPHKLNGE